MYKCECMCVETFNVNNNSNGGDWASRNIGHS